jgi:hypothetical protein
MLLKWSEKRSTAGGHEYVARLEASQMLPTSVWPRAFIFVGCISRGNFTFAWPFTRQATTVKSDILCWPFVSYLPSGYREISTLYLLSIVASFTRCMKLRHSWEANSRSGTQEFHRILWNPKVRCHVHKSPALVSILSQMNPLYTLTSYFFIAFLTVSFHLPLDLPIGVVPSGFPSIISAHFFSLPYVLYAMPVLLTYFPYN